MVKNQWIRLIFTMLMDKTSDQLHKKFQLLNQHITVFITDFVSHIVTFLIFILSKKYSHFWIPKDLLSPSEPVVLLVSVFQEMSFFQHHLIVCDITRPLCNHLHQPESHLPDVPDDSPTPVLAKISQSKKINKIK